MSIAQAVEEVVSKAGWQTKMANIMDRKRLSRTCGQLYKTCYKFFPSFFKVPFSVAGKKGNLKLLKRFMKNYFMAETEKEIRKFKADIVINTHFAYIPTLSHLSQQNKIKFINVVCDPLSIHPLTIAPMALTNLVYDKKSMEICQKLGVPRDRITITGWFVRQGFYASATEKKSHLPSILVCGGSEGANAILKIFPALLSNRHPLQTIVICGHNKMLYQGLKLLVKTSKFVNENLRIKILHYPESIIEFIKISDLVVGKSGPNLLFETIAAGKPFFGICHIHGQEDGNLEIIKQKNLGFVQENPSRAAKLLRRIIENPKVLKKFSASVAKEGAYNLRSAQVLQSYLAKLSCSTAPATSAPAPAAGKTA